MGRIQLMIILAVGTARAEVQCEGMPPVKSLTSYKGMVLDYDTADHICCNNHRWAERFGYAFEKPERDLFSRLDRSGVTVFYDSVCGLPLFVAPKGRSFEDWEHESVKHGWPSFRPAELVSENVIIHDGGRMESKCGTHLGHNLPQGGVDRYCIDLVCIAHPDPTNGDGGSAGTDDAADEQQGGSSDEQSSGEEREGTISGENFDADSYNSSAAQWSNKHPITASEIATYVVIGCSCFAVVVVGYRFLKSSRARASTGFSAQLAIGGEDDEADATNKAVATGAISMT